MPQATGGRPPSQGGIEFRALPATGARNAAAGLLEHLERLDLADHVRTDAGDGAIRVFLDPGHAVAADADTTRLCERCGLDDSRDDDLEREILLAMLLGPIAFEYPDYEALASALRVRRNIVAAARRTALAFDTTDAAERPEDYWTYDEAHGFTVRPGKPLAEALRKATQPDVSGRLYAFSCYRATEYVILLGLAEELAVCNPALLDRLQRQWETRAIMSGEFHEVFLHEYGSMAAPLPPKYYVPGDRLWFRNPDEASADAVGYEGSWVFYLGGGLFSNFWKRGRPYTLTTKAVEIYHWRHATYRDSAGELQVDEAAVDARVAATLADPDELARVLDLMWRWREPRGVYVAGGCIDTTREYPRCACRGATRIDLPGG